LKLKTFLRISLVACLLSVVTSVAAAKDSVVVRSSVDRKSILIGDRIKYGIQVTGSAEFEFQMPVFQDGSIGEFEIKDSAEKTRKGFFGGRTIDNWYYITTYSAGKKTIPQAEVKFKLKGAKDWSVKTAGPIDINVSSLLPPGGTAKDVRDIKGPLSFYEINWIAISGIVLVFAILIFSILIYRRMKRNVPVRLPHETAIEELEAIRALFLRTGDVREYYAGISDCVRRYIERAFKLRAPEMTTEEFLNSLRDSTVLSLGQKDLLKGFLAACDLVKFAKYAPAQAEAENIYTTAKHFIEEASQALLTENEVAAGGRK
jgi:hypothetical protein